MSDNEYDDPRRKFLIQALGMGLFALPGSQKLLAAAPDKETGLLLKNRSIYQLDGDVTVNGKPANADTVIGASDRIVTGPNSSLIFAVGKDAFILRDNSELSLSGNEMLLDGLRLLTGKLLSVFGERGNNKSFKASTPTAVIGIRGTGLYIESEEDLSYVCTCYGTADISSIDDPSSSEQIISTHHDDPRYITSAGAEGKRISQAPFINHTDQELKLIEALVGREPPFGIESMGYRRPRRRY